MNHGSYILEVLDILKGSSLSSFKHIESSLFYQLSDNLVGRLVSPCVDEWHADIINKDGHGFVERWGEVFTNLGITLFFDGVLKGTWLARTGKVHSKERLGSLVKALRVHNHGRCLSGTGTSYNQNGLVAHFSLRLVKNDIHKHLTSEGVHSWK